MRHSCSTVTLHDTEHGILAEPKAMTDFPIRLTFADELEHLRGESVGLDALTGSPTEHDAVLASRGEAGSNPLARALSTRDK
jgi:hypothetical protein